jgi:hypothetical protein
MSFKLITQQVALDAYVHYMIDDHDKYFEFVKQQAALEMAHYLLENYALYEKDHHKDYQTDIHRWTILVEDDPDKIIDEIVNEEKKKIQDE